MNGDEGDTNVQGLKDRNISVFKGDFMGFTSKVYQMATFLGEHSKPPKSIKPSRSVILKPAAVMD